jgi:hypothetical protein
MASYTIETSRDPNRITVRFLDNSSADFVLRDHMLERAGVSLPNHRELGNVEAAFGKKHLAKAEQAAHEHFFGKGSKEYESLMDARAEEFAGYIKTGNPDHDKAVYTTTALMAFAREFLKQTRWDMSQRDLVDAVRAYWTRKRVENAQKKKAEEAPKKTTIRAYLKAERSRQIDLFQHP